MATTAVSAAGVLAAMVPAGSLVVGPDGESEPLAKAVADAAGCDWLVMDKVRHGDRAVELDWRGGPPPSQRAAVLVDDICSSGTTLADAARMLLSAGARSVEALVVHALHDQAAAQLMRRNGLARIRSTDSLIHPSNAATLAPLLADTLLGALK
jgi:ribose-phosphate pyrophosphokinase